MILHNTMEAYQYDQEMTITLSGKEASWQKRW